MPGVCAYPVVLASCPSRHRVHNVDSYFSHGPGANAHAAQLATPRITPLTMAHHTTVSSPRSSSPTTVAAETRTTIITACHIALLVVLHVLVGRGV